MVGNPRDDAGEAGESALTSVSSLMEERVRYEAWLQALNARRAETPKHVYTRVHADYTARLEAVLSRLNGQVGALRGELTTLATRIATLDEQQHRARDERAEAELRSHVGELSPEAWQDFLTQSDATIARLARQHAQATEALRRTREFLSDAEKPATPVESAAPVAPPRAPAAAPSEKPGAAPAPVPAPSAQPAASPPPTVTAEIKPKPPSGPPTQSVPRLRPLPGREQPPTAAQPGPQGTGKPGNFDELAFLSSVVPGSGESPPGAGQKPAGAVPRPGSAGVPRPPAAPSRNPFAQRAQDKIVNNDGAVVPTIEVNKVGQRSGLAANVSGNNPIVLRDKANETAKTLKCGECGAVNYPTEWYCERCGAELASL
ncbi:MAG: hypothetical protein ACJ8AD_05475 [Gemmatimonadaceae bacterium]